MTKIASQVDWSELPDAAKLERLKKRVDEHDRDIAEWVNGETRRNEAQTKSYATAMSEAVRQIRLTTKSTEAKIDAIHSQSIASGVERERRKGWSRVERVAFMSAAASVIVAAIAAIASSCGHPIQVSSHQESTEK